MVPSSALSGEKAFEYFEKTLLRQIMVAVFKTRPSPNRVPTFPMAMVAGFFRLLSARHQAGQIRLLLSLWPGAS